MQKYFILKKNFVLQHQLRVDFYNNAILLKALCFAQLRSGSLADKYVFQRTVGISNFGKNFKNHCFKHLKPAHCQIHSP